ncbi:MAG TPA: radical SAM family heme chaperone HemW [Flavobacteriales bacterium]|nr:radical SAM family heme chaperone HemW [Flavobacteriales bacterium]
MAGIYIHIPYCKQACSYCNFHFRITQKDKAEMLKCINLELELRQLYLKNKTIETIYFGGGTPSILSKSEIKSILDSISNIYKIKENAEITLECNPDDLTKNKLIALKEVGINRLSIGVQSFVDGDLKFMNRSHNATQSESCIQMAQQVGFNNITIDLIYGLPNQSLADWKKNLNKMFALDIPHFSSYALTIEEKTVLKHLVEQKKIIPLKDEIVIEQFNILMELAQQKGFVHYEISNFGKAGFYSKHNTSYWKNKHYLGVGPSAHSFNGNSRSWNVSSNKQYIQKIKKGEDYFETEKLSISQQYNEYVFTSLRTILGVNLEIIKERFGKQIQIHFLKEIKKWERKKNIKKCKNTYTLTKSGKIFADAIASDLFIVD